MCPPPSSVSLAGAKSSSMDTSSNCASEYSVATEGCDLPFSSCRTMRIRPADERPHEGKVQISAGPGAAARRRWPRCLRPSY